MRCCWNICPSSRLIFALFTVGGGICRAGRAWGTPGGNTVLLAIGTVLASVMGTTGAAMVLIHPLLRANAHRSRKVHLVVFFILLVANVGGSLTPLGDPPLFLGFLRGVPFFWPAAEPDGADAGDGVTAAAAFWLLDRHLAEDEPPRRWAEPLRTCAAARISRCWALVVAIVLVQGVWQRGDHRRCSGRRVRRLNGWSAWW